MAVALLAGAALAYLVRPGLLGGGDVPPASAPEPFADVLRVGGGSNALGRAGEVVDAVLRDPGRLRELLDCVGDDDAWVRMRA